MLSLASLLIPPDSLLFVEAVNVTVSESVADCSRDANRFCPGTSGSSLRTCPRRHAAQLRTPCWKKLSKLRLRSVDSLARRMTDNNAGVGYIEDTYGICSNTQPEIPLESLPSSVAWEDSPDFHAKMTCDSGDVDRCYPVVSIAWLKFVISRLASKLETSITSTCKGPTELSSRNFAIRSTRSI